MERPLNVTRPSPWGWPCFAWDFRRCLIYLPYSSSIEMGLMPQ